MAPGQEKHLAHEGWHVVQQMQGRVQPTIQAKGVAINDDQALEREADVMGARAQRSGQAEATCCDACAATVDGGNPGKPRQAAPSPANTQPVAGQRATPESSSVDVPVIQRAAPFTPTPPSPEINLAEHFIAGYKFTGITVPTLNGTPIFGEADAKKAIKAPTLQEGANPDGKVFVEVGQVPDNKGSFVMAVPTNGPWSTLTDKKKASFLFRQVPGAMPPLSCLMPGTTTLTVNGKPTEADFASYALAHENLHAADHQSGFNDVIKAWDDKLQAAQKAVTPFPGATSAAAQAALYKAMEVTPNMGGTAREIAAQQHQRWQALNDVLHAAGNTVATGGPATFSNVAADPTCTTCSVEVS
jgi:hypothetical protein